MTSSSILILNKQFALSNFPTYESRAFQKRRSRARVKTPSATISAKSTTFLHDHRVLTVHFLIGERTNKDKLERTVCIGRTNISQLT